MNGKYNNLLKKINSRYFNDITGARRAIGKLTNIFSEDEAESLRAAAVRAYWTWEDAPSPEKKTDTFQKVKDRINNRAFSHRKSARAAVHTYKRKFLEMDEPKDQERFQELMELVEKEFPQSSAETPQGLHLPPLHIPAYGTLKFTAPQMSFEVTGDVLGFARELGLDAIIKMHAQHVQSVNASLQQHYQRELGPLPGEDREFAAGAEVSGDGVPTGIVFDRELEDGEMYPVGVLRRWGLNRNLTTSELSALMGNYISLASEVLPDGAEKRTKNGEPVNLRFISSSGQAVDRDVVVVRMPRDVAIIYGALMMTKSREARGKPKYLADFDPSVNAAMHDDLKSACGNDEACEIAIRLGPIMKRKGVDFNGLDALAAGGIASRKAN